MIWLLGAFSPVHILRIVLDLLFGVEEPFEYTSTTTSRTEA